MTYTEYQGWDEWAGKYKPVGNESFELFETYGTDLNIVQNTDPHHVWTWSQGDYCDIISAGYHVVNRLGYYITEVPWTNALDYCLVAEEVECECFDEETCEGRADCIICESSGFTRKYPEPSPSEHPDFECPICKQNRPYVDGSGDCQACIKCCKCIGNTQEQGYCMPY